MLTQLYKYFVLQYKIGNWAEAYACAEYLLSCMENPPVELIDMAAVSAWKLSENIKKTALALGIKAATLNPTDTRLTRNVSFYAMRINELFDRWYCFPIGFKPPKDWHAFNPSVAVADNLRKITIRTSNYIIVDGVYFFHDKDENVIKTKNYLATMDEYWQIKNIEEIKDATDSKYTDFSVQGFEDMRLCSSDGKWFASATARHLEGSVEKGQAEIVWLELDGNNIIKAEPIRGEWSKYHQKNWMPIQGKKKQWIYNIAPIQKIIDGTEEFTYDVIKYRGSSQLIEVFGGYLCVVHESTYEQDRRQPIYTHRFVLLNKQLSSVISMSDPFYFHRRGIEFCCGLALDNETLVLSFGIGDDTAWLGFVPLAEVMNSFKTKIEPQRQINKLSLIP